MSEPFDGTSMDYHWARSWTGPTDIESGCPCPKESCGMVNYLTVSDECPQHAPMAARTQRSVHPSAKCPQRSK